MERTVNSKSDENEIYLERVLYILRRISSGNVIIYKDESNWRVDFKKGYI